jgi:hypothetical protein
MARPEPRKRLTRFHGYAYINDNTSARATSQVASGREEIMTLRWTRISPQIALTPAVIVTLVAFIGSIFWTIYLSFTRSRRVPEYGIDWSDWLRQSSVCSRTPAGRSRSRT